MNNYYKVSPRGFGNEYDIISFNSSCAVYKDALQSMIDKVIAKGGEVTRITLKQAEAMTAHNRKLYRMGIATICNPTGATQIVPYTHSCYFATMR